MAIDDSLEDHLIPAPTGPFLIPATPPEDAEGEPVDFSLVLPTFNESANIGPMLEAVITLLTPLPCRFEVIVVDDDSPDHTWQSALRKCLQDPRIRVIRRVGERGLSSAVIRGWQVARGDWLGVIDADLQHPPEILLQLLEALKEDRADLAVATRHRPGGGVSDWALRRRIISRGAQALGLLLLPRVISRVSDPMSGCFILRRNGIAERPLHPQGYKILIEILAAGRFPRIHEAPYVFRERTDGESKLTHTVYLDYLRQLARLRFRRK